jgi:hypothetical protein
MKLWPAGQSDRFSVCRPQTLVAITLHRYHKLVNNMGKLFFKVSELSQLWEAVKWLTSLVERGLPGGDVYIWIGREPRTNEQNKKLWPMLTDISKQVDWYGMHAPEVWKDLITGTFRKGKVIPNLDGDGFVITGMSTSAMSKKEFCNLIEYIYAYGAEKEVAWSEPSLMIFSEYREAA